jgi:hypothetical protein
MTGLSDLDPDDIPNRDDQVSDEAARKQAIEQATDALGNIDSGTTFADLDTSTDEYQKLEKYCIQLADALVGESDVTWLVEDTVLSEREAEVYALKQRGLTHDAITLFYQVLAHAGYDGHQFVDGPQSRSTVDEYSRRARRKYHRAKETVAILESHYG